MPVVPINSENPTSFLPQGKTNKKPKRITWKILEHLVQLHSSESDTREVIRWARLPTPVLYPP